MGWKTVSALDETFGPGGTLQREAKGEVVLLSRLRAAVTRLNPGQPAEATAATIDELTRGRLAMTPVGANQDVYKLLKEGIDVSIPDREYGEHRKERLRVIDWERPERNDFLLVSQLSVT